MILWKYFNLIASIVILVLGIVTVVQFSMLVWQRKNEENIRKFKHLAIRFGVLAGLAILLQFLSWLVRYLYLWGMI
ncbi:MAG: hypothetical protein LUD79_00540 [Oscillospiraceae bacterium]|nr:hypothetical protein [Oscillospiraceae bacterium]